MKTDQTCILTINGGSSSIKFACYQNTDPLVRIFYGHVNRIGLKESKLTFYNEIGSQQESLALKDSDTKSAIHFLLVWLAQKIAFTSIIGVGHRVVHGMDHTQPEPITTELLEELQMITPYDPDHLIIEVELIKAFRKRHPDLLQVACFDTSFHTTMPRVAKLLPIPRRFDTRGIHRYGFHGLSYQYLMQEILKQSGTTIPKGRIILAHLGSGASLAAVKDGKCIDTSMGFTPAGGLVMGSRPGDLDPSVAWYIIESEKLTSKQFNHLINFESGLLGISETSSDMHDLLALEKKDFRSAEAIALFCYQTKKWIGSFAAALGGIDTLVFAGGIGENSPVIRSRICEGLEFLGIDLEEKNNSNNAHVISKINTKTTVRVIRTDEEWIIANAVHQKINTFHLKKSNHEK